MRIQVATWRDIDDDAAGGSELYLDRVTTEWARLGHEVSIRSVAVRQTGDSARSKAIVPKEIVPKEIVIEKFDDGSVCRVRRGGRFAGVPRTALAAATRRDGRFDLAIDVWNGIPFLSPLWARHRLVLLHHLHSELWPATFGRVVGSVGKFAERSVFPHLYRRTPIATLSAMGRQEILAGTALSADRVHVIEPGIDDRFSTWAEPDAASEPARPMLVAVCRFAPLKRVPWLVEQLAKVRDLVPDVHLVVVGDGEDRSDVEAAIATHDLANSVTLRPSVSDDELVSLYRSADLVVSGSVNEGWGMTITEAAACGTPAVVSRCAGHVSAVGPGAGVVAGDDEFAREVVVLLTDSDKRERASEAALRFAAGRTWSNTASQLLALADKQ